MKGIIILQLELQLEMQIPLGEGLPASEIYTWLIQWIGWEPEDTPPRAFPMLVDHLT